MSQPVKKIDTLRQLMQQNDWQKALSLAAKFPRLGKERNAILDAHGAYTNPRFAAQMGKDLDALKLGGINALRARYAREAVV